jgi:hypothetical protein
MTTERRFQVFVSSTYLDLRDERQAVTSALLQLDAFPAGMELFPAADDDAWTLIQRVIDDCDYYLLVIGGKYGSIDPIDEISYTEKEYDYANARGKPVMAFLHGDPQSIPMGKSETNDEARKKLEAFRAKVKRAKHVKYWSSAEQLAGLVALSFALFTKQYPAVGWMRADQQASPEMLSELNGLRRRIGELEGQLEQSRILPPPGTENLAQGGDIVKFSFSVDGRFSPSGSYGRKVSAWTEPIAMTWDDIFRAMAPSLLDESREDRMREVLDEWALNNLWNDNVQNVLNRRLIENGLDPEEGHFVDISLSIDNEDFGTVLVQLVALGLITQSTKKRSVTDTGTYWALTPYGRTRAIQLRAKKRSSEAE